MLPPRSLLLLSLPLAACMVSKPVPRPQLNHAAPVFAIQRQYAASDVAILQPSDETVLCLACGGPRAVLAGAAIQWLPQDAADAPTIAAMPAANAVGSKADVVPQQSGVVVGERRFATGSARLQGDPAQLQRMVDLARRQPGARIDILGFGDTPGDTPSGLGLRRATALRDWLLRQGLNAEQIRVEGGSATAQSRQRAVLRLNLGGEG